MASSTTLVLPTLGTLNLTIMSDKYTFTSKHALIDVSPENTVIGNMAQFKVTFLLWLYATVSVRDGMLGSVDTEEVRWYYHEALKALQETVKTESEAGEYSDHLLKGLACITATASVSGMFSTAILHRDATIRIVTERGNGDILKGLQTTSTWTAKALQWYVFTPAFRLPLIDVGVKCWLQLSLLRPRNFRTTRPSRASLSLTR